jgi:aspartate/tyrosine/aromatic aminotransferase
MNYEQYQSVAALSLAPVAHHSLHRRRSLLRTDDLLATIGNRIATIQTCAGTGALYVLCQLTKTFMKIPKVLLADPTWPNHRVLFIE